MATLYTYFRSSASFRVRIALNLKAVAYDPVVVGLPTGEQSAEPYLAINPNGLVPTWVGAEGPVFQSLAIMEYLDETYPNPPLLPGTALDRARIRGLAQSIACEIHPLNNLRVLKHLKRELKQDDDGVNTWYRHWCNVGLSALERQVKAEAATGKFMHGDTPSLADCCLVPQIFNAKRYDVDLSPFPKLMEIFDRCMSLEAFDLAQPSKQPEASLY